MTERSGDLLKFRYWPFDLVPQQDGALVWAGRKQLKERLDQLGQRLARHTSVSLHLLWADFGAGKTHALLYFKQQAEQSRFGKMLVLYSALPKGCRQFLDIYRAIVRSITARQLKDAYDAALTVMGQRELHEKLDAIWPSLPRCFQTIAIGSDVQRAAAIAWLHSEPGLSAKQLQSLSIFGRIKSTDEAVLALTGVVRLFNLAGFKRVAFLVDEFQRVETLRRHQQDEINAGLHGFFNNCGYGMSLVVSFSFGEEANIRFFLNQELLSRADPIRLNIAALTTSEASEFLAEVIDLARDHAAPWPVAPDVVATIVEKVEGKFKLTPRRLMKAAGLTFELASIDIEGGKIEMLTRDYVDHMQRRGDFVSIDDEGES